jgi:uncharacterized protein YjeT (DUF2065 family)
LKKIYPSKPQLNSLSLKESFGGITDECMRSFRIELVMEGLLIYFFTGGPQLWRYATDDATSLLPDMVVLAITAFLN